MDRIVNTRLLGHPVNWLIVWSVLIVGGYVATLAWQGIGGGCGCSSGADNPD
jgi:hypothetical protein